LRIYIRYPDFLEDINSSDSHDERAAVAMAMDNAPFDVKSWLLVAEEVDDGMSPRLL
jgi:hypothetical protein